MSERDRRPRRHTRVAVLVAVVLIAGAVASGIWSRVSGPTGEPAWIGVIETMTGP
ncbi:hypothetical protein [Frigoribacterium sp. VKM Ac-2836]|uniref:hypothetical protein n=1 Tax=Frigoribacterium sp. VKM Ac-2836 TaxID=2739014 RepID=UPI001566B956|nr:hypothetical protein [Frigoribacterium sp. VKM Ac-2836]NRD25325.1 hypothetical protein [Frigoribacterium sp. VKM Ac-2836]